MFGAIIRRMVTGGALLLAAFLAADAADIDDDLPDLTIRSRGWPPRSHSSCSKSARLLHPRTRRPSTDADTACSATQRCGATSRRGCSGPPEPGRRAALADTNLTQFAPDVIAGLYLPLFMFSGEYSTEYVERERLYLIRLRAGFRNLLPPGQFPYPFWHQEAKWGVYQAANSVLLWVNPKTAKIVIGQFTERGRDSPVVTTQPIWPKFDGKWMWMDKEGRIQPRVTLFDGLFRQDNPYLAELDSTYRTMALRMRDAQCDNCHVPNNPMPMRRLVLLHTPAHAAGEITRLMKAVRADKMPLDDTGAEQPLEPALKRALLESGAAFEGLVKAAKDWEAAHRD